MRVSAVRYRSSFESYRTSFRGRFLPELGPGRASVERGKNFLTDEVHTTVCMTEDSEIAEHYRKQAARLRRMALFLPGVELKANLRNATRMYEGFAEKLTQRRCTLVRGSGVE
jgi:hypothetical protein